MPPKIIELRPDRALLNPQFDGYKLSLTPLSVSQKELCCSIDRALPETGQYSLLHAKLFGLHNHIFGEEINGASYVYFVDKEWHVQKTYLEAFSHQLVEPLCVWQIPKSSERQLGQYNITLKFVTAELAVLSDGSGMLYLLNTGFRSTDTQWAPLYEDEILGAGERFVIQDAVLVTNSLHLLLLKIDMDSAKEHYINVLTWITLTSDAENKWNVTAARELQGKGELHYCYFEPDCTALLIVSENSFKFVTDSVNPINDIPEKNDKKRYIWSQTIEDITIKFKLPENYVKDNIRVSTQSAEISIMYDNNVLLSGPLCHRIEADLTTWVTQNDILEISLSKTEEGLMWSELVVGDVGGEFIVDTCIAEEVHQRLGHLCSDSEATTQTGTTFNSQQVEECDFVDDKANYFERVSCETHQVTHRVNLGTSPIVLAVRLHEGLPPALGLKHDVDVCIWQPYVTENWSLKHEGTLLAFGYIQASKQQKKFVSSTPDFNHAIICESSRHIFVYCQNRPVTSWDLKNRVTGRRVGTIAEQRVISLGDGDVLGMYVTNTELFVLTESKVACFKL